MPELPEVETVVRQLGSAIVGGVIESVAVLHTDIVRGGAVRTFISGLTGRRMTGIERGGKRIIVHLAPTGRLIIHLGMSGRLTVDSHNAPLLPHTHLRIALKDRSVELRLRDPRRFGGAWFVPDERHDERVGLASLGPDALTVPIAGLRRMLTRRRQVKALLLDQGTISGLGNIYCDEVLFAAGIHPRETAAVLDAARTRALHRAIRRTLRSAIAHGGSTFREYRDAAGRPGRFQQLHCVYGRSGEACPRCGGTIQRVVVASRSSHVCPACQPLTDVVARAIPVQGRRRRARDVKAPIRRSARTSRANTP